MSVFLGFEDWGLVRICSDSEIYDSEFAWNILDCFVEPDHVAAQAQKKNNAEAMSSSSFVCQNEG